MLAARFNPLDGSSAQGSVGIYPSELRKYRLEPRDQLAANGALQCCGRAVDGIAFRHGESCGSRFDVLGAQFEFRFRFGFWVRLRAQTWHRSPLQAHCRDRESGFDQ